MVPHRSDRHAGTPSGRRPAVRAGVLGAVAVTALTSVPADAEPDGGVQPDPAARVDRLHARAEAATEKYNAAAARIAELRARIEDVQDQAARKQVVVNRLRRHLGRLAGAQYRSGVLDPSVALLLSSDPDTFLAKVATLDRIGARNAERLGRLREAQRVLAQYRTEADSRLAELRSRRTALLRHKKTVQRRLGAAQEVLDRMLPAQRAAYERASRGEGRDPGPLTAAGAPSGRAAAAVAAARSVVGAPYGWGQAGPYAFDCSGLTQWAYARAGVSLPRTSQGQARAGRWVPLSRARPGDLVVYRQDASHVALYVGGGQVVHAPYPGAAVRYDPVGMMPVSRVTRP
ncbi:NlpC/P60 family protein [Streptomyces sp. TR06-5]|uniref:C40 family peptidase n=1 Tax=unclassified Streptomyces TaxID=2593676 RepID=UPI0039A0B0C8